MAKVNHDTESAEAKAADEAAAAVADDTGLVRMAKDGDSLAVHPSCVKAHEAAGWKRV